MASLGLIALAFGSDGDEDSQILPCATGPWLPFQPGGHLRLRDETPKPPGRAAQRGFCWPTQISWVREEHLTSPFLGSFSCSTKGNIMSRVLANPERTPACVRPWLQVPHLERGFLGDPGAWVLRGCKENSGWACSKRAVCAGVCNSRCVSVCL